LSYPKDQPLWYIYQALSKSCFGPVSSISLEEMLKENIINVYSEIRLIDIYGTNIDKDFVYFKLQDINESNNNNNNCHFKNFWENINLSNLIRNSLKGNKYYKIKFNFSKDNEFECFEMLKNFENVINIKSQNNSDSKPNLSNLIDKSPSIISNKNVEQSNNNINLLTSANNSFNKSNKIEKGVNITKGNNNNLNISMTPIKSEIKSIPKPIDLTKLNKATLIPKKEESIKIDYEAMTPVKGNILLLFSN